MSQLASASLSSTNIVLPFHVIPYASIGTSVTISNTSTGDSLLFQLASNTAASNNTFGTLASISPTNVSLAGSGTGSIAFNFSMGNYGTISGTAIFNQTDTTASYASGSQTVTYAATGYYLGQGSLSQSQFVIGSGSGTPVHIG